MDLKEGFFNFFGNPGAKGSSLSASARDGIWLLDDDISLLKALERLMTSAGLNADTFSNPVEFLARLEHARCHVAVLDVWMPQMSGLEVQACLRQNSPETRVIFITARGDEAPTRQTALDAGALAFLQKPFEDETLLRLIREALASSGASRDI